jgi:hypothetical protein
MPALLLGGVGPSLPQNQQVRFKHWELDRHVLLPRSVQPGAFLPRFAPKVWTISLIPAVTALLVLSDAT